MAVCMTTMNASGTSSINGFKSEVSFIAEVAQEITVSCALPFSIPTKEIKRIIELAAKWFYKHYEGALEERYYVIPLDIMKRESFLCDRTIILPDCVESIHGVVESFKNLSCSMNFDGTTDTNVDKFFFRDVFFSSTGLGNSSEALMYYIVSASWLDLMEHLTISPISYNYNYNSKKLVILGATPKNDIVLMIYRRLELGYLMNDELFYRYVVAKCKIQLARILGTFDFNLIGDIKINYDMIKEEGTEDLTKIEEEIKAEGDSAFFFLTNSY